MVLCRSRVENMENLFNPGLEAALKKLDPEDSEQILDYLKTHALLSREKALLQASVREQKKLLVENGKLKKDIEQLRGQLQEKQKRRAGKAFQTQAPPTRRLSSASVKPVSENVSMATASGQGPPSSTSQEAIERTSQRRRGHRRVGAVVEPPPLGAESPVDVSRLDLRVGKIVGVRRHPLAEAMIVQEVDLGENRSRTVVSKLGGKTDPDQLEGSLAVFLCNAKASKMRGVASQGRLLCCSASKDHVELIAPPAGCIPGDRITFLNYPGEPDRELPPKLRIWDLLQPDLQVDSRGVANYKGCGFEVKGKGLCKAPTLTCCSIR